MKKSEINFQVELDEQSIPERILWNATDNPNEGIEDTKAVFIATWDHYHKGTLALPLWTKDMEVIDMKRFFIEVLGSVANTAVTATGDQAMADHIENVCRILSKNLQEEIKAQSTQA
ncbi:gliding motility-associated protein GldC [Pseudarcicella hirudinis]|uniref:Gliding motility-associated protein GldC n=1 Tax=Pseudarcicella hirudinis TaxID=1079859 RepID=A0A1I5N343_9BACT|nr:gliding motility protein GldC [Pseudarcicella hirudinis]SFP16144.1 gliding motility-associated protein GldC [Pseudarcicella hirudinis]